MWWLSICLACLSFFAPVAALAWGPEGHRAIAALAYRYISQATRTQVDRLLVNDGSADLASISVWADDARLAARGTGPLKDSAEAHAFWDVGLVIGITGSNDYNILADYLARTYDRKSTTETPGDYHQWADHWVIESVESARLAYKGIQFGPATAPDDKQPLRISIQLPAGYSEQMKRIATRQLYRAAVHLANLLDRINWPRTQNK